MTNIALSATDWVALGNAADPEVAGRPGTRFLEHVMATCLPRDQYVIDLNARLVASYESLSLDRLQVIAFVVVSLDARFHFSIQAKPDSGEQPFARLTSWSRAFSSRQEAITSASMAMKSWINRGWHLSPIEVRHDAR